MPNLDAKEQSLQKHRDTEACYPGNVHPHGCFFCKGEHPSDLCNDTAAQDAYWGGCQNLQTALVAA